MRKFNPKNAAWLLQEREAVLPAQAVLDGLLLDSGQTFLDLGAGPGYYTLPALDRVRPGVAVAGDVQEEMLTILRDRAPGLPGLVLLRLGEATIPLHTASVDRILMANVIHECLLPDQLARECHRILKDGGKLLLVDWAPEEMDFGPPLSERMTPDAALRPFLAAGFTVESEVKVGEFHWAFRLGLDG